MSSVEDTHANPSPLPENEEENTTPDTSGLSSHESYASYDHDTQCWRTSQATFLSGSDEFSGTWPTSGTMRNGRCYGVAKWVRHTHGPECSLWPAPTASSWGATGARNIIRRRIADGTLTERDAQWLVNGNNGRKNPEWTEWLMGFPAKWTEIEPSGTP